MRERIDSTLDAALPLLLKPAEAGRLLGVSADHVYRLIANGVLEAVNAAQPGSKSPKTRVPLEAVHEYIARLRASQK
ncbi:helix-turn-helix domain-containing protein [Jiangella muralis]|uniref:helix-turn-helix domain-containing protein n=1 Tax=Jiangella muralis TaxID=702383 RepID=UPI00069E68BD|nr:helix-turn-helix domain-containing protein [Jiangella muralis]